jgi:glutathione S-transferase
MKVNGGFRHPEDARKSLANPNPSPDQLLPNEYVERSRRMHANDLENIPLFLIAGLLYVCTSPRLWLAAGLFAIYVVSRLAHFLVLLTHRSHEVRALFWTIGSVVVYFMAGAVIWHALAR